MGLKRLVRNVLRRITNSREIPADVIPRNLPEITARSPWLRTEFRRLSIEEDEQNSYYHGMLNTLTEDCVGTLPLVLGNHPIDEVNDAVEDKWKDWCVEHGIGGVIRQVRRAAARTGIGIAIPYNKSSAGPLGLGFKTICSVDLTNPITWEPSRRIVDGIEYDENWDPIKIFVKTEDPFKVDEYAIEDIIFWHKYLHEGMLFGLPECYSAFCLFPSVRRFIEAIVKSEEFRSAVPLAIELDKEVYRPEDADPPIEGVPSGTAQYKPGSIVTLPPGTKLTGVPISISGSERAQFIKLVIGAAARSIRMPYNIAMGDSSNHNMATAAIDVQPWHSKLRIDRNDFEPAVRKFFKLWFDRAILVSGYLPVQARKDFSYELNYDATFEHPDPKKRADARAVDLASGATTLHEVWTEKGKNPRRQLDREAKTLGLTREQYNELIIAKRVQAPQLVIDSRGNDEDQ